MRKINFANLKQRIRNGFVAALFISAQVGAVTVPFLNPQTALAANEITASNHEGQLKPSGTYTNGNVTTYTELDSINFRFTLDSSTAASGTINIVYGSGNGSCAFFQQPFTLGTHDGSAQPVVNVSGTSPSVTTVGSPVASGQEWIQTLQVNFTGAGEAVVNYNLQLTDTAGDCSGSSTHTQFGSTTGAFKNAGAQAVSIPANDIIELAQITVTKYVDDTGNGQYRTAHADEWNFSLNGGQSIATDANGQVIFNHLQTSSNTISESSVSGYSFVTVSGTNCVAGNTSGTATATVTAATTAVNASCNFYNAHTTGSLELRKAWVGTPSQTTLKIGTTAGANDIDSQLTGTTGTAPLTTGQNSVTTGTYFMSETADTNYTQSIACFNDANNNGTNDAEATVSLGTNNSVVLNSNQHIICTFTNTRNTGSVKVSKMVDSMGSGSYVAANPGIFTWSLDGSGTNAMGSTINNINTGSHTIGENTVSDYHFVGWYAAGDQHSCASPTGITLPSVMVTTSQTSDITLCNAHNTGTLRVLKNVDLNGDGDYTDAGETGATNWQWQANAGVDHNTGDAAITVPTGDYALTETNQTDFHQVSLNCVGGTLVGNTVTVTNNANVVCTFVNARDTGTVSFLKSVLTGDASPSLWLFTVADPSGTTANSGDSRIIQTGTYTVTESNGPAGYSATGASGICSFLNDVISLTVTTSGGQCEVQNTRDTGSIKVVKDVVNDNGGAKTYADFSFTLDGTNYSFNPTTSPDGERTVTLPTGTYSVVEPEANTMGYSTSYDNCANITVVKGQTQTCTITNNDKPGKLTVNKVVVNREGDDGQASDFSFKIDGDNTDYSFVNGNDTTHGSKTLELNAGTYSATENDAYGYDSNDSDCKNVVVTNGNEASCTITNTAQRKVYICHATAADNNPYVRISVPVSAIDGISGNQAGHGDHFAEHKGPVWYPGIDGVWGDIIPPLAGVHDGLNWDIYGQATYNNDCNPPAQVIVTKYNDLNRNGMQDENEPSLPNWDITLTCETENFVSLIATETENASSCEDTTQTTGVDGTTTFTNVLPGNKYMHTLYETIPHDSNWNLSNIDCGEGQGSLDGSVYYFNSLGLGETIHCSVGNYQDTGTVTIIKKVTPSTDQGKFNLNINGTTYAANVGNNGTTGAVKLVTGGVTASETAGTNTSLGDYEASYNCVDNEGTVTSGTGSSLAFNLTKDQDVVCTFTNNKGEVLGAEAPTVLVNTGNNILLTTIASFTLISAVAGLSIATRRRNPSITFIKK